MKKLTQHFAGNVGNFGSNSIVAVSLVELENPIGVQRLNIRGKHKSAKAIRVDSGEVVSFHERVTLVERLTMCWRSMGS